LGNGTETGIGGHEQPRVSPGLGRDQGLADGLEGGLPASLPSPGSRRSGRALLGDGRPP